MQKMRKKWGVLELIGREIHQSWGVVMLAIGVIVGAILGIVLRINYFNSPVWIVFVVAVFVLMYLKPRLLVVGLCLIAGMVLMFFRVAGELSGAEYIQKLHGSSVVMMGEIEGDAETDEGTTKLKLGGLRFGGELVECDKCEATGVEAHGSIYVSLNKNEDLRRGDKLILGGKMSEGFGTYAGYMYRPKILKVLKPEPGNLVVGVRDFFAEKIKKVIPELEANLGLSYLLGMKTGLDTELSESLRMVGLTHIVVASGAHLSILVEIARKLFGRISRFAGLMFSIVFILFFMCMVGWTPSILRAGVMAILTLASWYVGRKIAPLRLIVLVAALTLIVNPMFLLNMGWLLSFASYAGIMLLGPFLTRFFYGEKKPGFFASVILTTLAATLMTLPIILYYYGQVSIISVVANLLILPTLPYAMGAVFVAGVFSGVPFVETAIGFVATKILDYHIWVVEWFSKMEQFLVTMEPYEPRVFLMYVPIVVGMVFVFAWKKWGRGRGWKNCHKKQTRGIMEE